MSQIRLITVSGSVPTVNQLAVGDIAVNSYDGKAFLKKVVGNTQNVIEIGSGITPISASYAATASYLTGTVASASYAISASYALSASYASTASYALTASSALNAQDILIYVKNQSGNDIAKGVVVHITASGNSSDIPRVITASYENDGNSANTLGITNQIITNGSEGYVMTEGVLKGIDTNAFVSGQLIYLGATGSITGSAPRAPLHAVRLGQVVREQSNNGSIYVRIDNGYELGELHDVLDNTTSGSYGDLLVKSGSLWINSKQLTGSYGLTGSLTATSFTGSFSGSGTITSASFSQTASFLNPLSQTVRLTGSLVVTGSIIISGSGTLVNVGPASFTGSAGTGSALAIYKSGSNVLSIDGSSGRLFSVDDSLSGSLFSVNTAAGLPVIEAFSDNTVNIGKYGSYPLTVSGSTLRATGSFTGSFNGNLSGSANLTTLTASGALINGNVTINGTASISFLNVTIESASVIYSTGSNQLGDAANDTQTLYGSVIIPTGSLIVSGALQISSSVNSYIIGSGSVGIGTTTPSEKLQVIGNIRVQSSLTDATSKDFSLIQGHYTNAQASLSIINTVSNATQNIIWIGGSNASYNAATDIRFFTAVTNTTLTGTERMRIASDGNVGIGTTNPTTPLYISSSANTGLLIKTPNPTLQLTDASDTWYIQGVSGDRLRVTRGGSADLFTVKTNGDVGIGVGATAPTARLQVKGSGTTSATTAFRVEDGNTSASFVVRCDGRVGVGTASPTNTFEVSGSATISGSIIQRGGAIYLYDGSGYGGGRVYGGYTYLEGEVFIRPLNANSENFIFSPNNGMSIGGFTIGGTAGSPPSYGLAVSGSVGIGTRVPAYKLDVSGSGRFTNGLNVTGSTSVAGIITQLDILNALPAYYQIINLPSSIPGGGGAPTSLISIPSGQPVSMFIEYQIINTATMTDQRSGTIMANFNSLGTPTSTFTETVTADIGNTSGVVFTTNVGAFYDIQATNAGATPFSFKAILRYF